MSSRHPAAGRSEALLARMLAEHAHAAERNHPNRRQPDIEGTPSPATLTEAREAAGLDMAQAAAVILHEERQWAQFEAGQRRMHPIIWWAFQQRVKGAR